MRQTQTTSLGYKQLHQVKNKISIAQTITDDPRSHRSISPSYAQTRSKSPFCSQSVKSQKPIQSGNEAEYSNTYNIISDTNYSSRSPANRNVQYSKDKNNNSALKSKSMILQKQTQLITDHQNQKKKGINLNFYESRSTHAQMQISPNNGTPNSKKGNQYASSTTNKSEVKINYFPSSKNNNMLSRGDCRNSSSNKKLLENNSSLRQNNNSQLNQQDNKHNQHSSKSRTKSPEFQQNISRVSADKKRCVRQNSQKSLSPHSKYQTAAPKQQVANLSAQKYSLSQKNSTIKEKQKQQLKNENDEPSHVLTIKNTNLGNGSIKTFKEILEINTSKRDGLTGSSNLTNNQMNVNHKRKSFHPQVTFQTPSTGSSCSSENITRTNSQQSATRSNYQKVTSDMIFKQTQQELNKLYSEQQQKQYQDKVILSKLDDYQKGLKFEKQIAINEIQYLLQQLKKHKAQSKHIEDLVGVPDQQNDIPFQNEENKQQNESSHKLKVIQANKQKIRELIESVDIKIELQSILANKQLEVS